MLWNEALDLAKPILKNVVDLLAEKDYQGIKKIVELENLTTELIAEVVDGYLELNGLSYIDKYEAACNLPKNHAYCQTNGGFYKDNSGFWIDYDLTTDSELNDLTLQMSFLFEKNNQIKPFLLDIHVM